MTRCFTQNKNKPKLLQSLLQLHHNQSHLGLFVLQYNEYRYTVKFKYGDYLNVELCAGVHACEQKWTLSTNMWISLNSVKGGCVTNKILTELCLFLPCLSCRICSPIVCSLSYIVKGWISEIRIYCRVTVKARIVFRPIKAIFSPSMCVDRVRKSIETLFSSFALSKKCLFNWILA